IARPRRRASCSRSRATAPNHGRWPTPRRWPVLPVARFSTASWGDDLGIGRFLQKLGRDLATLQQALGETAGRRGKPRELIGGGAALPIELHAEQEDRADDDHAGKTERKDFSAQAERDAQLRRHAR